MTTETTHAVHTVVAEAGLAVERCRDCAGQPYRLVTKGHGGRHILAFYRTEGEALGDFRAARGNLPRSARCARPGCTWRLVAGAGGPTCFACGRGA